MEDEKHDNEVCIDCEEILESVMRNGDRIVDVALGLSQEDADLALEAMLVAMGKILSITNFELNDEMVQEINRYKTENSEQDLNKEGVN